MRLVGIIFLACQILYCKSEKLCSASSYVSHKSENNLITNHKLDTPVNVNDDDDDDDDSLLSKVNFRLYTSLYPNGKEIIFKDDQSLKEGGFKPDIPTRICTHGFNGKGTDYACMGPTRAFLSKGQFNVIVMDWSQYQSLNYLKAVKQVKDTALHLAEMINFLEEQGMNTNTTTLIGHSLGAHIVGIAGFNAKSQINHVVGVDSAQPGFKNKGFGERISTKDATHVEVIHTNGNRLGMLEAVGHYDFYLNGGTRQPGCGIVNSCSHARSNSYYTESIISSKGFYGRRCDSSKIIEKEKCTGEVALMGGLIRTNASPGVYFVETNSESPYAKGYPGLI